MLVITQHPELVALEEMKEETPLQRLFNVLGIAIYHTGISFMAQKQKKNTFVKAIKVCAEVNFFHPCGSSVFICVSLLLYETGN